MARLVSPILLIFIFSFAAHSSKAAKTSVCSVDFVKHYNAFVKEKKDLQLMVMQKKMYTPKELGVQIHLTKKACRNYQKKYVKHTCLAKKQFDKTLIRSSEVIEDCKIIQTL